MMAVVLFRIWKWNATVASLVIGLFLFVDGAYFASNLTKFAHGGWFPLAVAAVVFVVLTTWATGRQLLRQRLAEGAIPLEVFIKSTANSLHRVRGTSVFMASSAETIPSAMLHNIKHNQVLHERVVILTVQIEEVPHFPAERRAEVTRHGEGFNRVVLRYGFMDEVDVPHDLAAATLAGGPVQHDDHQLLPRPPEADRHQAARHVPVAGAAVRLDEQEQRERDGVLQAPDQPRRRAWQPAGDLTMKPMHFAAALLLAAPTGALADELEGSPICTDRPAKANAVCTVPTGKWQVESGLVGWSLTNGAGTETKVLTLGASAIKLGLSDRSDIQVYVNPYVHTEQDSGGVRSGATGFGDLTVRYKHRLTDEGSKVQVAAIPFVKFPIASDDIGNGKVEGGLAVPVSMAAGPVTLVFGPELDLLADADGQGHHAAVVNLVNVSGPIADGVTLIGEVWTMTNFDPADTATLVSLDAALAYAVTDRLQLDLGANVGLTKPTPDAELYLGVSARF